MAIFVWEGRTAQGRLVKGDNLEAPSLEAALARLREQRIRPIPSRVREKGRGLEKEISIPGFGDKVTTKDISLATRQLATMIDAGLPIVQCLDILAQQSDSKLLCKTISAVKKDVEGGTTLADALRKHP
ncbi:MAG TPA: type II secretion system F family protein, partial [Candidatus Binatia bacterium]|nr:type II secretion system F family protein [Candidatus Binatia bacterium]